MRNSLQFIALLVVTLIVGLAVHLILLYIMNFPLFSDKIILSYGVNFLLAAGVYMLVQRTFKKNGSHAGFIFMVGSGVKFLVFFLVFYPAYQSDNIMENTEFASFFVPYALCLILEVIYLSKQLNNQTYSEENPQ